MKVKSESEVAQSCPTLSDPMDCSLPGSSAHGVFQARVLEWGAIAFSTEELLPLKKNKRNSLRKTDLASLPDPKFKKEVIKMLNILRKTVDKKADHCNKELETRRKPKLDNSTAEIKTKIKAINSRPSLHSRTNKSSGS